MDEQAGDAHEDAQDDAHEGVQEARKGRDPEPALTPSTPSGLTRQDVMILALERRGASGQGAKERAIREQLGLSPTRYYQLLNALLDDRHALDHDPVTVNRLRRRRDARRDARQ